MRVIFLYSMTRVHHPRTKNNVAILLNAWYKAACNTCTRGLRHLGLFSGRTPFTIEMGLRGKREYLGRGIVWNGNPSELTILSSILILMNFKRILFALYYESKKEQLVFVQTEHYFTLFLSLKYSRFPPMQKHHYNKARQTT